MDRVRYLNGQVTNDVRQAKPDATLHACVTNLKGKIEADIFIHAFDDALILDAPEALRESLGMRLERYIIADDAVLEDITDEWQLVHGFGKMGQTFANEALSAAGGRSLSSDRLGLGGHDIWLPAAAPMPALDCPALTPDEAEDFRILQRIPAAPNELNTDAFPQEVGLEKKTMSYTKGCYIGQEILSRIKSSGKMPRQLVAWESDSSEPIAQGAFLSAEGKVIGTITSRAIHPLTGHQVGLGFIRQGAASADSELLVSDGVSSIGVLVKISAFLNQ
jgi:tRNA-modifying protein YgfZ